MPVQLLNSTNRVGRARFVSRAAVGAFFQADLRVCRPVRPKRVRHRPAEAGRYERFSERGCSGIGPLDVASPVITRRR